MTILDLYYCGKVVALCTLFLSFSFCWTVVCITMDSLQSAEAWSILACAFCMFSSLTFLMLRDTMVVIHEQAPQVSAACS